MDSENKKKWNDVIPFFFPINYLGVVILFHQATSFYSVTITGGLQQGTQIALGKNKSDSTLDLLCSHTQSCWFCKFCKRMLPIAWNIQDSLFSGLCELERVHLYRDNKVVAQRIVFVLSEIQRNIVIQTMWTRTWDFTPRSL